MAEAGSSRARTPALAPTGYTLLLRNTTRVCATLVPDACLKMQTRDTCLLQVGRRGGILGKQLMICTC